LNFLGILDFLIAYERGKTSDRGPLHLNWSVWFALLMVHLNDGGSVHGNLIRVIRRLGYSDWPISLRLRNDLRLVRLPNLFPVDPALNLLIFLGFPLVWLKLRF